MLDAGVAKAASSQEWRRFCLWQRHLQGVLVKQFKWWASVILLLLIVLVSAGFSLWNTTPVPLSLGFHTFAERAMAVWIIAAFCIGGLVGLLIGSGLINQFRLRRRIRQLERELESRPRFERPQREV